ncbi:MAG: hypothetical protein KTR31_09220 [Myxococcales bacterium]|nr:hypothetical protein [Myxococcales bacterium]
MSLEESPSPEVLEQSAQQLRRSARLALATIAAMGALLALRMITLVQGDDPVSEALRISAAVSGVVAAVAGGAAALLGPGHGLRNLMWLWWALLASPMVLTPLGCMASYFGIKQLAGS